MFNPLLVRLPNELKIVILQQACPCDHRCSSQGGALAQDNLQLKFQ